MSRLAKISFVSFMRGAVLFVLLAMSLLAGLQILLDPHVNVVGTDRNGRPQYGVIDAPVDSTDVGGVNVHWVSPLRMDAIALSTLAVMYLILPFTYLCLRSAEKRLERGIVGKGTHGEDICLRPEAIERVITREVRSGVEDVTKVISCEALQGSSAARVSLSVAVSDRSTVSDVQSRVRAVVKDTLTRLIGYSDGSQISVKVVEVAGAGVPSGRRKQRPNRPRRELPAAKA